MKTPASKIVRYAVVGIGHIAQAAVLPAFGHVRKNSRLAGIVSSDARKRRLLGKRYNVDAYSYEDYEACLATVDAVYIALPNSMHEEYTVRAARAGVHVLCEKPLAVTVEQCERMIEACHNAGVKLMTAYRLHFESMNLRAVEMVRRGRIGEPKVFSSTFSLRVKEGDIRTRRDLGGGTLYDLGVYCINAARYLFRAEPKEVIASSVNAVPERLPEIDESTGALLRFEGERIATFVTSFNASDTAAYTIIGTRGHLTVNPAYEYAEALKMELTVGGKTKRFSSRKRDQFAAEIEYFSDCILRNREPEPSGLEGLQDVRIVQALYESADTGKPIAIPPYEPAKRPDTRQEIERPPVPREPELVNTRSPTK